MPFTVKLMRNPIGVEFEVGSVSEALGILQDNKDKFLELLAFSNDLGGGDETVTTTLTPTSGETAADTPKRGRGKGKAAAEAVAPAPIAVPGAAAPPAPPVAPALNGEVLPPAAPPVSTAPAADGGIPDFLKRDAAPTAAAAPPPPPLLPAAPPVVPEAPKFVLGNKIADDLQKRLDGSADKGAALQAWLMPHVTAFALPGASIDEVIALIRFTADEKVAHLAAPLGIS